MTATKKKLEVLFKANFPALDKPSDSAIRTYLEGAIVGIKIRSIETYAGKGSVKAVVTSNIADMLTGSESTEDSESFNSGYVRGKSMSVLGSIPGFVPPGTDSSSDAKELAERSKEASDLRLQLRKLEAEFDTMKKRSEQQTKSAEEAAAEMNKMLQEQVGVLSRQLESVDNEKSRLEHLNRELSVKTQDQEQRLAIRRATSMPGSAASGTIGQLEAMEELVSNNKKKFEDEKQELQDKLAMMSIKLLSEQEKTETIIFKSNKADNLEKAVTALEKEKQELAANLHTKETETAAISKKCEDAAGKLAAVEQSLKLKEAEAADSTSKVTELESKLGAASSRLKSLENSRALANKEQEVLNKRIETLEGEKSELTSSRDKLREAQTEFERLNAEKDGLRQEAATQQKAVREREEQIRSLKLQVKEKEDALHEIEADRKSNDKQADELQKRLDEAEKKCAALERQMKHQTKADRAGSSKQKVETLEADVKRKEKDLKASEEARGQLQRELIILQAKFNSTEKALASRNEEIRDLKAGKGLETSSNTPHSANHVVEQPGPRTSNSSMTSAVTEAESSSELARLKKELDDEKLHSAQLNGRYLETREELEKTKGRYEQMEKETGELKVRMTKLEILSQSVPELEGYKTEAERLRVECQKLQTKAEEGASAVEQMATMQKQHELMVKENTDLKASLYEVESSMKTVAKSPSDKKLQIIEEIRGILAEVIYVYKTLDTNAKQFVMDFETKKERAKEFAGVVEQLGHMKREEQLEKLKALAADIAFLHGFPLRPESVKGMLACLTAAAERIPEKMQRYEDEIGKFNTMLGVSKAKVGEYEQKLAFYY